METIIQLYQKGLDQTQIRLELQMLGWNKKKIDIAFKQFFAKFKKVSEVMNYKLQTV